MKRLLIFVMIAIIFSHFTCALSESSISASNEMLDTLIARDGLSEVNLPASEPTASLDHLNHLEDRSNKDEIMHRIASTELKSGPDPKLDRLGTDEVKGDPLNAGLHLGSYSTENLDRLLSGHEESEDISKNNLIASSYLASYMNPNFNKICSDKTESDGEENDFRISSSGLGSDAGANMDRLLLEIGAFEEFTENDPLKANDHDRPRDEGFNSIRDIYITSYAPSDQNYSYKYLLSFAPAGITIAGIPFVNHNIYPKNDARLENISYRYENGAFEDNKKSTDVVQGIDLSFSYIKTDAAKVFPRVYNGYNSDPSLGRLDPQATGSSGIGRAEKYAYLEVNQNLDVLTENDRSDEHIMPYLFGSWNVGEEPSDKRDDYPKNYAVVVGINSYTDWSGLKSPVNDAHEISEILEACGYEILEITDETEIKPTKENILSATLDDIRKEEVEGNIIFYFSGHGVRGDDGTFYLVPQDAKRDDLSSCISELELRGYLKDLDNLAVIIDACNSGDLKIANKGQLVLTSSKKDELSNEEWFGSLSVFTYNLCKAIEEEMLSNGNISLSECFYKAREDTVRWSSWRLISQTPEIIDFTGGNYYIK